MSGHNIFYIWDFFHIQGAALVKPAIDLSNKVSCYTSDIRRQRSRIVSFYMRFLPSFKCCIGKTGIELDFLSEISSIFTGLHSEIFKWQQPSKHNFYQVFLYFLIWHPSNGVCCISCPCCIDSELLLQHPELTMNRRLTFPWVFYSFFVDLNRRLSSNQSSRISWNPLKHYSCNMNIFYLNNGWVRCWICIFYLKNWCNFFYLWVLQYTTLQHHFFCLHKL